MTDYKHTLNLPITGFSMKANLVQREPEMVKRWEEENLYQKLRESRQGCEKFVCHDGPPYANGDIHIGHAVNKTLKDIIIKAKTLSGYDAAFIPGWDCHGLPIELNVEKNEGKAGINISAENFRKACRHYAQKQVKKQSDSFKRLGILADWDVPYLTMDRQYEAEIIRSLAKIVEKGYLQRGFKPVYWCIDCGSALAEAEVEYQDKHSPAIDVRFRVLDEEALMARCHHVEGKEGKGRFSIPIWTTTPWSLPANHAVALNSLAEYAIVQCETSQGTERLVIAEALLKEVMMRYDIDIYRVVAYCRGNALEGLKLQHPFYEREVPVVLGDHVTMEAGTGAVHTAPGHGQDDYIMALKYGLPIDNPVGDDGCFLPNTPLFAGEFVYKANDHIIEILKAKSALLRESMIEHSYPHCWRHKTPLIYRATPQWFISMEQHHLREDVVEAVAKVTWIPDWGMERIAEMVMNRPDWCISRQRAWGVPITLFVHKETGELHPNQVNLMERIAERIAEKGIEAWYELDITEFLGKDATLYRKVTDILDVWFESGVSHACVLRKRKELAFPADLYLEGSDQHRGWFQSSIITSTAMNQCSPCRQVLTHGFVVDGQGRKMSKSLGNVVSPADVMKTLGADILRLWVASVDYTREINVSEEILKRLMDAYRRIRNTARYLLSNIADFDPKKDRVSFEDMLALDHWAVNRARLLQQEIIAAYDSYQFHLVYQKIHQFCSIDMGSFYLDIIKDRQYTMKAKSLGRRSAQTSMYHIIEAMVRWIAPVLSFTADEIWSFIPGDREKSVFLTTWYQGLAELTSSKKITQADWEEILSVRNEVNKQLERLRNEGALGSALEAEVQIFADKNYLPLLKKLEDELRFIFITSRAEVLPLTQSSDKAIETEIAGIKLMITPSSHRKCVRCWHRRAEVGTHVNHPELCSRCVANVSDGEGEMRLFA